MGGKEDYLGDTMASSRSGSQRDPDRQEDADSTDSGEENAERGNWTGKFDFILSCIGFAVGLGNVWRFPFLCYRNGGGAFLIPYVIMLCVAGLPLFYFELAFGQFANLGPITIWRVSPFFKGIGWAMVIISALVCIYYNVVIAWAFYYLFASFTGKLPWSDCEQSWNDAACRDLTLKSQMNTTIQNVAGNSRWNHHPLSCNATITVNCTVYQTPAEQYWERVTLGITNNNGTILRMDDPIGLPQWHLALCLLLSWIVVFLCLLKGVKSSGKVVYFTATFPYLVLVALLIRGVTLDGAREGIEFFITPKWEKLMESKVWADAAVQIFYSLGVGFGGLMTMASFNKFQNNCYRDALIVSIVNCSTSVFAGFVIFSVIGYMSFKTGVPIEKVAKSGPGLAFIAYPEGIAAMPVSPLWAILFFFMILTLGLDSQFAMMETVLSGLSDEFPWLRTNFKRECIYKAVMCTALFFLGLPLTCKGGLYLFTLIDWYSAGFSLFLVAFCELVAVSYVYGIKKYLDDIKMMLGFRPGPYWIGAWMIFTPAAVMFIFFFSIVRYTRVSIGDYVFPDWAEALGWLMVLASFVFIPGFMIWETFRRGFKYSLMEEELWGPCVDKYWYQHPRYTEKLRQRGLDPMSDSKDNPTFVGSGDNFYSGNEQQHM